MQNEHKMTERSPTSILDISKEAIDVLFLSQRDKKTSHEIIRIARENNLSVLELTAEQINEDEQLLDLVGTAVLDMEGLPEKPFDFNRIIQSMQRHGISVILLDDRCEPEQMDLPRITILKSSPVHELWGRISANLFHRYSQSPGRSCEASWTWDSQVGQGGTSLPGTFVEQLKMAGQVQRDFLPRQLPNSSKIRWSAFFAPAEWVSGDIYDIRRLDENYTGFYLIDAVGHSMPAALLTIFLKQAIRMRETTGDTYRIFEPVDVVRDLNIRMAEQKLSGCQFATCCYCLLNTKTLQMTYARAGHPYPVLIRNGCEPCQLESRGALLGVFRNGEFTQETVQLHSKDKIFLYSDGADTVVGSPDSTGRLSFNEKFCEIMNQPVEEMMQKFKNLVENHTFDFAEHDDITAIGLEIL
ncbi:MAG: PP2C family protein-serine/threonine phosphatase [Planctomycetota bacterium]